MLTHLSNEVDDILAGAEHGHNVTKTEIDLIRSKYDTLTQVIPANSELRFEDGSEQRIDFRPVLEGEMFAPLQDLEMFNAVELDPTFGTVQ